MLFLCSIAIFIDQKHKNLSALKRGTNIIEQNWFFVTYWWQSHRYFINSWISVNVLKWEEMQINKIFITPLFPTLTKCTYFLRFLNWYFNKAPSIYQNIYYIIHNTVSAEYVYKITYQPSAISTYYITESLWLRSTIHSSFLVSEFIYK